MATSPIKPVKFYKIGGFKQSEQENPFKGFNPFQFANPYQMMYYQNQQFYQQMQQSPYTPKSSQNDNRVQNQNTSTPSKKVNNNENKKQITVEDEEPIPENESKLDTIEEENSVPPNKPVEEPKPVEKAQKIPKPEEKQKIVEKKTDPKSKTTQDAKDKPSKSDLTEKKISENEKKPDSNEKQIESKPKSVEKPEKSLKLDLPQAEEKREEKREEKKEDKKEEKKEVVERFEKTDKNQTVTPRSKDGKSFAIRGTTKTIIEVTTTELVDESIFKTKEPTPAKITKKNNLIDETPKKEEEKHLPSVDKEIQTDNEEMNNDKIEIGDKEEKVDENVEIKPATPIDDTQEDENLEDEEDFIPVAKNEEEINEEDFIPKKNRKKTKRMIGHEDGVQDDPTPTIINRREDREIEKKPTKPRSRKEKSEENDLNDRTKSLNRNEKNDAKLVLRKDNNENMLAIRKRESKSLDERNKIDRIKAYSSEKDDKRVIRNFDKIQAKRFEESNLKFPSLVTEKPAPHRFKLKFKTTIESPHSSYDGYKRCPCLMHNRRYYEKYGHYPDEQPPEGLKSDRSHVHSYWNDHADSSVIFGEKNVKFSARAKTGINDHAHHHIQHHHHHQQNNNLIESHSIQRPAWNEAF